MKRYVLDTSVVIKWFSDHDEADLDKAIALRDGIFDGSKSIVVPDLLLYELANALRHNPHFNYEDVSSAVQSVIDMGFETRTAEGPLLERSIQTAYKFNITVYDACFLAVAHIENKPLITADDKLAKRAKGFKQLVRLADL